MYKKILVPLDGSQLAECALLQIQKMAKEGSVGEVTLLNVVKVDIPSWSTMSESAIPKPIDVDAIRKPLFNASRNYLAKVESRLGSEGIKVKTESLQGDDSPADTITNYANENGMDMIVIATHGYTGFKKMLLGSVAFGILHQSNVPVLLIRPESCRP